MIIMMQVWSLPQSVMTGQHSKIQTHGIQTIAPLAKVRWRPKRSNQIASIVNSFDLGVNVWELTRPSIPFATFTEHSDVVTSKFGKFSGIIYGAAIISSNFKILY